MKYILIIAAVFFISCKKSQPNPYRTCYDAYDANNHVITDTFPRSSTAQFPNGYSIEAVRYCTDKTKEYINSHKSEWPDYLNQYNVDHFGF